MKLMTITILLFAFFSTFLTGQTQTYIFNGNPNMTISGTSNLHDWVSAVGKIKGETMLTFNGINPPEISKFDISIDVYSIKSNKGKIMNNKTYDALKAEDFPNIQYQLKKVNAVEKTTKGFVLSTTGNLTIAGVTQVIDMKVNCQRFANEDLVFTGSKKLKMTDYNIEPPTALLGTLKTGDEITIDFNVKITNQWLSDAQKY